MRALGTSTLPRLQREYLGRCAVNAPTSDRICHGITWLFMLARTGAQRSMTGHSQKSPRCLCLCRLERCHPGFPQSCSARIVQKLTPDHPKSDLPLYRATGKPCNVLRCNGKTDGSRLCLFTSGVKCPPQQPESLATLKESDNQHIQTRRCPKGDRTPMHRLNVLGGSIVCAR